MPWLVRSEKRKKKTGRARFASLTCKIWVWKEGLSNMSNHDLCVYIFSGI